MPGEPKHAQRRQQTVEDIERFQLKLITLGVHYVAAFENTSDELFTMLDDALSLSPTRVLQSGIMYWVAAAKEQGRLYQRVWNTLTTPSPPPSPRSGVIDGRITFFMDQHCEASAPVLTDIPQTEDVSASDLRSGRRKIPSSRVAFSAPSNGAQTYVVSLSNLGTLMEELPPGRYVGKLSWGNPRKSQIIEARLDRTPE